MAVVEPLVSIIIPSYQSSEFVSNAIKSCLSQTYKNIEIIVIDDGSTDNTRNILSSYIDAKKINYIYQNNKGLSAARNTGLRTARGEYIQFLDSDDIMKPEKIQLQINYLINHPEDMGVYSDYVVQKNSQIIHYKKKYPTGNLFKNVSFSHFVMPIHTVLLRAENLPLFDEALVQGEDRDFWLNIFQEEAHSFGFINQIIAIYMIHDKNMTHQTEINLFSIIDVINKHLRKSTMMQKFILEEAKKYHFGLIGIHSLENALYQKARYYLKQSFSIKSIKYKSIFFISYLLSFSPMIYQRMRQTLFWIRRKITHRRSITNESH